MNPFSVDHISCNNKQDHFNRYPMAKSTVTAYACLHRRIALLFLLGLIYLSGCKTVPLQDRNYADRGGFWEQGTSTQARFHHQAFDKDDEIGVLYASGRNTILNGSAINLSSDLDNHSVLSNGPQSSARLEFKGDDEDDGDTCVINIDRFNRGDAYADTYDCWYHIKTPHALLKAKNAILHIDVTQNETEVVVISGAIKVFTHGDPIQSIDVNSDQEVIISHQMLHRPRSISPDEIWNKISWRAQFQLYKTVIDWDQVVRGAIIVGIVAAIVAIGVVTKGVGLSGFHRSRGFSRH